VAVLPDGPGLDDWVVVGRLGRPHGLNGELTVELRTDDPEGRFGDGALLHREGGAPVVVASSRWHNGVLLLTVDGVSDRAGAEALRDTLLHVDPALDPPLPGEDDFYDHQLLGLRAELADGTLLGAVTEVLHPPGTDLLAVRRAADGPGGAAGEELLLPFVRAVVPQVDVPGGRVVVTPPAGLL